MKLNIFILSLLFFSCHSKTITPAPIKCNYDSVIVLYENKIDSILRVRDVDTCQSIVFHLEYANSKLKEQKNEYLQDLIDANSKLKRVEDYLNICLRNPSQDKFLKGWIKRALQ